MIGPFLAGLVHQGLVERQKYLNDEAVQGGYRLTWTQRHPTLMAFLCYAGGLVLAAVGLFLLGQYILAWGWMYERGITGAMRFHLLVTLPLGLIFVANYVLAEIRWRPRRPPGKEVELSDSWYPHG